MKEDLAVLLWLTSFLMTSTVSCELITYNVALNRPAYQSSVLLHQNYRGYFAASLANDGNYETNAVRGGIARCAHSLGETNPWWAVDLGRQTAVYRVDFTNRGDANAFWSNNFIVGLTNVSPNVSRPTLWNYTLCGQYPGAVPAAATVSLYCQNNLPSFRYVIVQFPRTGSMNFCELEVLVRVPNPKFHNVARLKPASQVSTYMDQYGPHPAPLANDGSRQTNYAVTVAGCAASDPGTNPWWAVDLEAPTIVYFVKLTNRGDANGYRSDKFVVGLTNKNPDLHAPVLWNYMLCGVEMSTYYYETNAVSAAIILREKVIWGIRRSGHYHKSVLLTQQKPLPTMGQRTRRIPFNNEGRHPELVDDMKNSGDGKVYIALKLDSALVVERKKELLYQQDLMIIDPSMAAEIIYEKTQMKRITSKCKPKKLRRRRHSGLIKGRAEEKDEEGEQDDYNEEDKAVKSHR